MGQILNRTWIITSQDRAVGFAQLRCRRRSALLHLGLDGCETGTFAVLGADADHLMELGTLTVRSRVCMVRLRLESEQAASLGGIIIASGKRIVAIAGNVEEALAAFALQQNAPTDIPAAAQVQSAAPSPQAQPSSSSDASVEQADSDNMQAESMSAPSQKPAAEGVESEASQPQQLLTHEEPSKEPAQNVAEADDTQSSGTSAEESPQPDTENPLKPDVSAAAQPAADKHSTGENPPDTMHSSADESPEKRQEDAKWSIEQAQPTTATAPLTMDKGQILEKEARQPTVASISAADAADADSAPAISPEEESSFFKLEEMDAQGAQPSDSSPPAPMSNRTFPRPTASVADLREANGTYTQAPPLTPTGVHLDVAINPPLEESAPDTYVTQALPTVDIRQNMPSERKIPRASGPTPTLETPQASQGTSDTLALEAQESTPTADGDDTPNSMPSAWNWAKASGDWSEGALPPRDDPNAMLQKECPTAPPQMEQQCIQKNPSPNFKPPEQKKIPSGAVAGAPAADFATAGVHAACPFTGDLASDSWECIQPQSPESWHYFHARLQLGGQDVWALALPDECDHLLPHLQGYALRQNGYVVLIYDAQTNQPLRMV